MDNSSWSLKFTIFSEHTALYFVVQAMKMNGFAFGWQILPDQMQVSQHTGQTCVLAFALQVASPILILLLIPLFDQVIYPVLGKKGI